MHNEWIWRRNRDKYEVPFIIMWKNSDHGYYKILKRIIYEEQVHRLFCDIKSFFLTMIPIR